MTQDFARHPMTRRHLLGTAALAGLVLGGRPACAGTMVDLGLPGGQGERPIANDFPEKGAMILQRARPPLLETPFEVFDQGVFTPTRQFYVRWHWAVIPTAIDVDTFRLAVRRGIDRKTLFEDDGVYSRYLNLVNSCQMISASIDESRVFAIVRSYLSRELRASQSCVASFDENGEMTIVDTDQTGENGMTEMFEISAKTAKLPNALDEKQNSVFVDRTVSPACTVDVARATRELVAADAPPGIYNCVNSGFGTWADVAAEAARLLGVPLRMRPLTLETAGLKARRPRFCALSNEKLARAGVRMPDWRDALARYVAGQS